ncbi:MAG: hypothetical protein JF606_06880 [Burkholderiales bacterium]|jgi:hypothetical protein|nr:hypothetical protein [Burkholderiales bacterium]
MKIRSNSLVEMQPLLPDKQESGSSQAPKDHHAMEARWKQSSLFFAKSEKLEPSGFQGVYISRNEPAEFRQQTREALRKIDSKPAGAWALQQLAALNEFNPKKMVIIKQPPSPDHGSTATAAWENPKWPSPWLNHLSTLSAKRCKDEFIPYVAGQGADRSIVEFVPSQGLKFEAGEHRPTEDPSLGFTTLGHELIHSIHHLHGTSYRPEFGDASHDSDWGAAEEELRTCGVGPWRDEIPSENAIRREHGVREAPNYSGNTGKKLRPPPETNSPHTEQRLRELGAVHGRPLGRPPLKED